MRNKSMHEGAAREVAPLLGRSPRPSPQFRRRSWFLFQRALDPLAPPRPLREKGN
jgi:hypothetical protein